MPIGVSDPEGTVVRDRALKTEREEKEGRRGTGEEEREIERDVKEEYDEEEEKK
jgi:hypothetical protein